RVLGNRVRLPDLLPRRGVERHDTSAEAAAFVAGYRAGSLFAGRRRHVEPSVVKGRRAGDASERMIVDLRLPDRHAALRVDGVHRTGAIAYERDVARRTVHVDASDRDRRAHGGSSREVPVDAASRGVERVDVAALAADEHAAADNGRLSI